jgi:hypothetical protein
MAVGVQQKVDELLRESLKNRGVVEGQVDEIDLFPTPEGILAEVVLRDASALDQARQATEELEGRLESEHIALLPTVRALWTVESIERIEIANPPGVPPELVGLLFRATLKSGTRHQEVWVAVTPSAQQVLRPLAPNDLAWLELIRAFLGHRLAIGGPSYWDPIRDQKVELGESEARYLRWRPYEQLKRSVNSVFRSLESAEGFLEQFTMFGKKVGDINHVLEELPGPAGAIARGERLPTSNYELYEMLLASEKDEIAKYYASRLDQAGKDWPELKEKFPSAFAK